MTVYLEVCKSTWTHFSIIPDKKVITATFESFIHNCNENNDFKNQYQVQCLRHKKLNNNHLET